MQALPEIPAQDFFLGLTSAGILLSLLFVLARPREPRSRARFSRFGSDAASSEPELFADLPLDGSPKQAPFLGSLFSHLVLIALVPWLQLMYPESLPFNLHRYDMVVVQFKMKSTPLQMPPELRKRDPPAEKPEDLLAALPDLFDDSGAGNQQEAPKLTEDPGGKGQEPDAPKPAPQRYQIVLPERQARPQQRALAEVAPPAEIELKLPILAAGAMRTDIAWEFKTPHPDAIPNPGIPALAELGVEPPELAVQAGLPTQLPFTDTPQLLTPALSEVADMPTLGELGDQGWGTLLAGGADQSVLELSAALQGSAFGPFFGGGSGAGGGRGAGAGDEDGTNGAGGDGFGRGYLGRGAVPRSMHGIIVISNDAGAIPEAAEVLSGNPVYTVYVEVPGFTKKWVLQVCVPLEQQQSLEQDGGVIRVLSRKSLDPPFAFHKAPLGLELTGRPLQELPPRIVVFANVTENGDLSEMRVISGVDPATDNLVMANLQSWEFHPAFRDGEPVAVEALFGIPLR